MKTVMIFDSCGETELRFYVLEGNYSHLNNVYINSCHDEDLEIELRELLYTETFDEKCNYSEQFPIEEINQDTVVIVCGFTP